MADPKGNFRIDARAVNVETGAIEYTERVQDTADNVMGLIGQLRRLTSNSGLKLGATTDGRAVQAPAGTRLPMRVAVLYGKALDMADKGDKARAVELFGAVLKEFPDYTPARSGLAKVKPGAYVRELIARRCSKQSAGGFFFAASRPQDPHRMKPLLLTALGHPLIDAPFGRRGDDVEVRGIPGAADGGRAGAASGPPCSRSIARSLASAGEGAAAQLRSLAGLIAIVGIGDRATEPGEHFPDRRPDEFHPGRRDGGHQGGRVSRRVSTRRGARRDRGRALDRGRADARARRAERDRRRALDGARSRHAARADPRRRRVASPASDAGSLYLVERDESGAPTRLRFAKLAEYTLPSLPFTSFTVPIDSLEPRRLRRGDRRAARDRRRLSASRRRHVLAEPELRREVRLPHEVDARHSDEDASRRDHRRAAADQPQARRRDAAHVARGRRARSGDVRRSAASSW